MSKLQPDEQRPDRQQRDRQPLDLPPVAVNPHWQGYRCVVCDRAYPTSWEGWVCGDCGIAGILDVSYDYAGIAAGLDRARPFPQQCRNNLWRFAALLPLQPERAHPAWAVGASPSLRAPALAHHVGVAEIIIKDDTALPSGSLKDRAAAMAVADARRLGRGHLACASTGNAAASLALLAARAQLGCTIYVPADAPPAKLAQIVVPGAGLVRVEGSYDQAFELSLRAISEHGWYSRNCAHNPLLVEGKKTATLELLLQLSHGFLESAQAALPDAIFVPVGDGCIVASVAKAVAELHELGLISALPRVYGVQAAGAAPLARAWQAAGKSAASLGGRDILDAVATVSPRTIADSIAVGVPRNRVKAWRRVAATGGGFIAVSDEAIIAAIGKLARQVGVFVEPSGAAGLAGLEAAVATGLVTASERVAVLATGHGLKDPAVAMDPAQLPAGVAPD